MIKSGENPRTKTAAENNVNGSRKLLNGLLAGIAIGLVGGFLLAKSILDKGNPPLDDNKSKPKYVVPHVKGDAGAKCNFMLDRLTMLENQNQILKSWIGGPDGDAGVDDELTDEEVMAMAQKILAERINEIIDKLGITNEEDIENLKDALMRGYNIEQIGYNSSGDQVIDLSKTEMAENEDGVLEPHYRSEGVALEEDIEIPGEYEELKHDEQFPGEDALKEKMINGDFEDVLESVDYDSILDKASSNPEVYEFLQGLIEIITNTTSVVLSDDFGMDYKRAIACQFPVKTRNYIENCPKEVIQEVFSDPDYMSIIMTIDFQIESMFTLLDIEGSSDCVDYLSGFSEQCIEPDSFDEDFEEEQSEE